MIATFIATLAALLCRDLITRTYDKYKFRGTLKRARRKITKATGVGLVVFASLARAQPDSVNVKVVADYVEVLREHDSTEAADIFLLPFEREIDSVAKLHKLPPELLAAFIQEESAFDQWATRYEPHYAKKRLVIAQARAFSKKWRGVPTAMTEVVCRSSSFGLMQVMGQLAREQGFGERYLVELIKPFNSIEQGAINLQSKLKKYGRDTLSAISAYNQGNNRRKGGVFVNARYVYRVAVAWEAYRKLYRIRNETYHIDSICNGCAHCWRALWLDTAWLRGTAAADGHLYKSLRASLRDGTSGLGSRQLRLSARTDSDIRTGYRDTVAAAGFTDKLPSKPVLCGLCLVLGLCVCYVLVATQPGYGKRMLDAGAKKVRPLDALRRAHKGHDREVPAQGFAHHHP